nr:ATP-binding protein [Ardenticatena sp.]
MKDESASGTDLVPFGAHEYLLALSRALSRNLDLGSVLHIVLEEAVVLLQADAGFVALRLPRSNMRVVATTGLPLDAARAFEPLLNSIPNHIEQNDTPWWRQTALQRALLRIARRQQLPFTHIIAMPLEVDGEIIGVLITFRSSERAFTRYEERLLAGFADQASIAIRNAMLVRQLVQERERLAAVLANSADGVALINAEKRVELINPALARLSGWTLESVVGQPFTHVLQLENEAGVRLPPPSPHDDLVRQEGYLIRCDGRQGPYVSVVYTPLAQGRGMVASVHDLSERRALEASQRAFIAGISHELKTPLAIIIGYAETLLRDDVQWDEATWREGLHVILDEAHHLTRLVDNLLDAARLEAGGLKLHLEPVQLDEFLPRVLGEFARAHLTHHFDIQIESNAMPPVMADSGRLRQVLHNLLSNAVKYAPEGTTVRLRLHTDTERGEVIFCISDEGPGIPLDEQGRIFQRFHRAKGEASRTEGAGLGLYMARAIVEAHGGRIWVESEPGKGATFCVALPIADDKPPTRRTIRIRPVDNSK